MTQNLPAAAWLLKAPTPQMLYFEEKKCLKPELQDIHRNALGWARLRSSVPTSSLNEVVIEEGGVPPLGAVNF